MVYGLETDDVEGRKEGHGLYIQPSFSFIKEHLNPVRLYSGTEIHPKYWPNTPCNHKVKSFNIKSGGTHSNH
jgi:hypothetical protein